MGVEDIAKALLSYDQSQVEYYGLRTKDMVGKVLTDNDVVEPMKSGRSTTGYRLKLEALTEAQRLSLTALCDQRLAVC